MNADSQIIAEEGKTVMPADIYLQKLFHKYDSNNDGRLSKF